jgi:hypothetical protein
MAMMRPATFIAVALGVVMLAAPASASAFDFTHRLTITVEYKYDWTISPDRPDRCGRSGSGFFRSKASTRSVKVQPGYNRSAGRFVIAVPYGKRGLRDMPPHRLLGSYEVANNAPFVGPDCEDLNANDTDRRDCGAKQLPKRAQAGASTGSSDTPRRLTATVGALTDTPFDGHCQQAGIFDLSWLGFKPMYITAPSKKQLRKSSFTLQGSQTTHPDVSSDGVGSGNATRTVRLLFTKL